MKNIFKKIMGSIVLLALLGFGVYYFLMQGAQNTILRNNITEDKQSKIEYIENNNELTIVVNSEYQQTLSLDADAMSSLSVAPNAKKFITDLDVNFDGQNDVGVFLSTGYSGVNNYYDFYVYNSTTQLLEKQSQLSDISNPILDIENKKVISNYRSGPNWYQGIYTYKEDTHTYTEYVERPDEISYPINSIPEGGIYEDEFYSFEYPKGWYVYDDKVKNFLILLKTEKLVHVATEIYALGEQIIVNKFETPDTYSSAIDYLEENVFSVEYGDGYEGSPTKVLKENINGREVFRVEHSNVNSIPTMYYYFIKGRTIFTIKLYPYRKDEIDPNYDDFMSIVNSFSIK